MKKGGLADSPFFRLPTEMATETVPQKTEDEKPVSQSPTPKIAKPQQTERLETSRNHATKQPRYRDTTTPRDHDTMIEVVRKAVREFGKEAATHRFTLAEKKAIADILYAYKGQGIKTSENEIARIAINHLIQDYRKHGENSVLHKVIEALNT